MSPSTESAAALLTKTVSLYRDDITTLQKQKLVNLELLSPYLDFSFQITWCVISTNVLSDAIDNLLIIFTLYGLKKVLFQSK